MQKKTILSVVGLSLALTAAAVLCAQVLLRNLSALLAFDETFSAIFAQIATADMESPVLMAPLSVGMAILLCRLWQKKRLRFVTVLLGALLWLLLFFLTVLLTRVNGIRFCDVLFSLLDVVQKGGL